MWTMVLLVLKLGWLAHLSEQNLVNHLIETWQACQNRLLRMMRCFSDDEKCHLTKLFNKSLNFGFSCTKWIPVGERNLEFNQSCKFSYLTKRDII